jgi:hypothetical protein
VVTSAGSGNNSCGTDGSSQSVSSSRSSCSAIDPRQYRDVRCRGYGAFRLVVNRSVTWADWGEERLALDLQELSAADFDLSLTGFDPGEIGGLLDIPNEERANAAPPLPEKPVSRVGTSSARTASPQSTRCLPQVSGMGCRPTARLSTSWLSPWRTDVTGL